MKSACSTCLGFISDILHDHVTFKICLALFQNVIAKEMDAKSCQCAAEHRLTMNPSEENAVDMHFMVKPLAPDDGWESDEVEKVIII